MQTKKAQCLVDGKECGRELTEVEVEAKKLARYDLVIYKCSLGHCSYFSTRAEIERPSDMAGEEIEEKMDKLICKSTETRDPEIREEIYTLGRELEKMETR